MEVERDALDAYSRVVSTVAAEVTPHVASLTEGKQLASSTMAAESILSVLRHERPAGLVNPEVWERPGLRLPHPGP